MSRFGSRGFTFLEVTGVVVILAILAIVAAISYRPLLARADAARCMSHMRSLHVSFAGYIQDNAQWPQEPEEIWESDDEDLSEDWWIETLTPYGGDESVWQCPTLARQIRAQSDDGRPRAHYAPTRFDERTMTPYRWSGQPWLIEIGNIHGRGAHILFPDGSIRVMSEFMPNSP